MYHLVHNSLFKIAEELIAMHRTAHEKPKYNIFGWLIDAHDSLDVPRFAFMVLVDSYMILADSVPKNIVTSKQGGDRTFCGLEVVRGGASTDK
jgi:hypothetical protein